MEIAVATVPLQNWLLDTTEDVLLFISLLC